MSYTPYGAIYMHHLWCNLRSLSVYVACIVPESCLLIHSIWMKQLLSKSLVVNLNGVATSLPFPASSFICELLINGHLSFWTPPGHPRAPPVQAGPSALMILTQEPCRYRAWSQWSCLLRSAFNCKFKDVARSTILAVCTDGALWT